MLNGPIPTNPLESYYNFTSSTAMN